MRTKITNDDTLVFSESKNINNDIELTINILSIKEIDVFPSTVKIYTKAHSMFVMDVIVKPETIDNWRKAGIVVNVA